jgi:hypothetical protein
LAISVSAKYRLQSLDIGQNIGLYRLFHRLSAKYRLWKNIGIGIGGQFIYPNISVSAEISGTYIGIGWTHISLSLIKTAFNMSFFVQKAFSTV